jgi:hypothetical protein
MVADDSVMPARRSGGDGENAVGLDANPGGELPACAFQA